MNLQINGIGRIKHEICILNVWRHASVSLGSLRAMAFKLVIQILELPNKKFNAVEVRTLTAHKGKPEAGKRYIHTASSLVL
jgi:hypothetical protein